MSFLRLFHILELEFIAYQWKSQCPKWRRTRGRLRIMASY
jgi:hypothetical protein